MSSKNNVTPEQALAGKLKAAFNSATFLGYTGSAELLMEALDQTQPLTELERKAAHHAITEQQLRAMLDRERELLKVIEAKATTPAGRKQLKAATSAFNKREKKLHERVLNEMRTFNSMTGDAYVLANKLGKPQLAETVYRAYRNSPYSD